MHIVWHLMKWSNWFAYKCVGVNNVYCVCSYSGHILSYAIYVGKPQENIFGTKWSIDDAEIDCNNDGDLCRLNNFHLFSFKLWQHYKCLSSDINKMFNNYRWNMFIFIFKLSILRNNGWYIRAILMITRLLS